MQKSARPQSNELLDIATSYESTLIKESGCSQTEQLVRSYKLAMNRVRKIEDKLLAAALERKDMRKELLLNNATQMNLLNSFRHQLEVLKPEQPRALREIEREAGVNFSELTDDAEDELLTFMEGLLRKK